MEATTLLCSTVTGSYPRDPMFPNRERIILTIVARRHCHVLHVGSWKLPLVSKHNGRFVWLKFLYSVDWTCNPWICINYERKWNLRISRNLYLCTLSMILVLRFLTLRHVSITARRPKAWSETSWKLSFALDNDFTKECGHTVWLLTVKEFIRL